MGDRSGNDAGLAIFSLMVSGVLFYGGLGWLLDLWLSTRWGLPVGLILGAAAGIYLVVARYGRSK